MLRPCAGVRTIPGAMDLLRKLFGGRVEGAAANDGKSAHGWPRSQGPKVLDGSVNLPVVGESHYQDELWQLVGGRSSREGRVRTEVHAILIAETNNVHDANAISVQVNGLEVGYLSRDDARRYRPGLLTLQERLGGPVAVPGVIAGGGAREDGPALLGVFLRHDPANFGLSSPHPRVRAAGMMTGLSDAMATDAGDDSYDLAWLIALPEDPIRAISTLRGLLKDERDPIDRHFIFHHLERSLYRSRDAFTSALDEFDECCRQHDAEMDSIRSAFLAKWGRIPWLETYKQMCIRLAKADRPGDALWWADRGIAIYGDNAARPEALEDLRTRAATYRAKLARPTPRPLTPIVSPEPKSETLHCVNCGRTFQRPRARGRKPTTCVECRGASESP